MRVKLWHLYVVPVFLIGLAIYEYVDLTAWEAEGGVRFMGRSTRALYKLGGKWGVVGFTAAGAAVWSAALFTYIRYTRRINKQELAASERQAMREVEAAKEARRAAEPKPRPAPRKPSGPVSAPAIPVVDGAAGDDARRDAPTPRAASASDLDDEPSILK